MILVLIHWIQHPSISGIIYSQLTSTWYKLQFNFRNQGFNRIPSQQIQQIQFNESCVCLLPQVTTHNARVSKATQWARSQTESVIHQWFQDHTILWQSYNRPTVQLSLLVQWSNLNFNIQVQCWSCTLCCLDIPVKIIDKQYRHQWTWFLLMAINGVH